MPDNCLQILRLEAMQRVAGAKISVLMFNGGFCNSLKILLDGEVNIPYD